MKYVGGDGKIYMPNWKGLAEQQRAVMHRVQAIEARSDKTAGLGPQGESAVAKGDAPGNGQLIHHRGNICA